MLAGKPLARLVVRPGTVEEREVPIYDRIFVGRECSGVQERNRVLIDEPDASRNHLEIRLEPEQRFACVVDTSTNGTRVNGVRIERGLPVPLASGDRITIGRLQLEFRSELFGAPIVSSPLQTARNVTLGNFVMVVGDIVGFSTIAQRTSSRIVMESLDTLLRELRRVLARHRGTLSNFVGDAFFAVWELESVDNAAELATRFTVAAADRVYEIGPELGARLGEGRPLRMGWGVSVGEAAVTSLTGTLASIVGDAANVAFRLSGLAGRDGRSDVLLTEAVCRAVAGRFPFDALDHVEVRGRRGAEAVRGLRVPLLPR